ncbi:ACP S-malonyltransferase [Streptomyces sp. MUM 203J]|uniref:ACP S-malonyltransferase n=1 Tax=Streptomyces sp. MUM 203J TaxID=2791990 RepID=UPI001F0460CE|nr:hypothetical protein [Streptomyces sp. MUM 203J]
MSGRAEAVSGVMREARLAGARRVVDLGVHVSFHSSLMAGAEAEFAEALSRTAFRAPEIPVLSATTASPVTDAAEAAAVLRRQLSGRVRWTDTVQRLTAAGVDRFVEVGPGRVLGGLCRRIAPGARVRTTDDARRLDQALGAVAAA